MADNLTTGTTISSIASGTVIATHDLSGVGGTGQAQKVVSLAPNYTCTGADVGVSVSTTVVKSGVGLTVPANTSHALITVEAGDVRFREDGSAPTSTTGCLLVSGSVVELPIPGTAANLQFIQSSTSTGAATLNISYRSYR